MANSHEGLGPNTSSGAPDRPRQDPVSCESCRRRKQKCSREQPCSNCASRGVECVFVGGKAPPATAPRTTVSNDICSLRSENAAIKARLDALEELVLNSDLHPAIFGSPERPAKVRRVAQSDVTIPTPDSTLSSRSDQDQAKPYQDELERLGSVGCRENTRLPQLSTDFDIRIGTVQQIVHRIARNWQERCIFLPTETQSLQLFHSYVDQVDPMQHIIHVPTVERAIEQLYAKLQVGERVEANETVLLLSILASIAFYWIASDFRSLGDIFSSAEDASQVANLWLRTTLDVLEHVKRAATSSLETVQAGAILVFLIYHMEGFSPKVRAILAGAISTARDLALHQTDSPRNALQNPSKAEIVHMEMRRRVWWHLCGTDWSLAVAGGPHEGTYNVNPKHMKVKHPRNVSDEELETMPEDFEHATSEPTIMAYYLQRIRLSEISRDITDMICDTEPDDISVNDVLAIDARFQDAFNGLPSFLRKGGDIYTGDVTVAGANCHILLQRFTVNLILHARRCKFHLPLLLRASYEPQYSFSRKACLESARAVMQHKHELSREAETLWISSSNLGCFLHLAFYATVVLVMDICVNRSAMAAGEEAARKEEIQEALQTLERAKKQSVAADMFLESLKAALHKHSIRLQTHGNGEGKHEQLLLNAAEGNTFGHINDNAGQITTDLEDRPFDHIDFDALWQSYIESGLDTDPHSWDPLITDLEACVQGIGEE